MTEKSEPSGQAKLGRRRATKAKRLSLMFRLSEPVHAKVWEAAEASGRSLSEELEHRINQSFVVNDVVTAVAVAASTAVREAFAAERRSTPRVEQRVEMHQTVGGMDALGAAVLRHLCVEATPHLKPVNRFGRVDPGH